MNYLFVVKWETDSAVDIRECINSIINGGIKDQTRIIIVDTKENNSEISPNSVDSEDNENIRKSIIDDLVSSTSIEYILSQNTGSLKEYVCDAEYYIFMDEYDRMVGNWQRELEIDEGKHQLLIGHSIYSRKDGTIYKYNLSLAEMFSDPTKEELIRAYYLAGGEDRFLSKLNNKFISHVLMQSIWEELEYIPDNEDYDIGELINFFAIVRAESIYYNKNLFTIYGIKKEENIFDKSYQDIIDAFKNRIGILEKKRITLGYDISDDWNLDWYRYIRSILIIYHPNQKKEIYKYIEKVCDNELSESVNTGYFESLTTDLGYSFKYKKDILNALSSDEFDYIGFDIFDTLIQRPFWEPTDLFKLLNKKYNELVGKDTVIDFSLIRKDGESGCRGYQIALTPANEDVTLSQIYDFISEKYGIDKSITDQLMEYEIFLEKKYCTSRKIGKLLFETAKESNKKILIVSDMYLPETVIEEILEKNGYTGYEKLYISNTYGISKYSGRLFEFVLKDQKIKKNSKMCFIGDNYGVDVMNSSRYGIKAFHIPKATDIFMGTNKAIASGSFFKNIYEPNGGIVDQGTVMKYFAIRTMMAVVANEFYGDPFVDINKESDFDADPKFIGYYCVGMFLYSEALWLIQENSRKNVNTIHFAARDGYWVKEAYDKLKSVFDGPKSNYMYLSRKAIAPLYMVEPEGIYELFLPPHILNNTPENVVKMLKTVVKDNVDTNKSLTEAGIPPYKKFPSLNAFYIFAKFFRENLYDANKAKKHADMLWQYFSDLIVPEDVLFDVGYSGRMENALTKLLGFPLNSCYFHEHEPWALMRKQYQGFSIDSFYSFKPCSAFVLREQILTPNQPSCIGFEKNDDGSVTPVFSENNIKYKEEIILSTIQEWSMKFIDDMVKIFGADLKELLFNKFDACIPFEYFMHYAKPFDQKLMAAIEFEDEFGTNETISLYDYWKKEQKTYRLLNRNESETVPVNNIVPVRQEPNINVEELKNQLRNEIYMEEGIFKDGVFMKMYSKLNGALPVGSKRRNFVKKILGGRKE